MNYLFFDTSANGQPQKWNLPYTDAFNWPRMIQLSWVMLNEEKKLVEEANFIIKPAGFEITPEIEQKHKLSHQDAVEKGAPLKDALIAFKESIQKADMIWSHNLRFNENVVMAEFLRAGVETTMLSSERYCLMRESTHFAKIPDKDGRYKWPSLQELYTILFGKRFKYANNAYIDAKVTAACFFGLRERGALEDIF